MTIGLVGTWLALAAAIGCQPEATTKEGLALPTGVEEELQRYHPEILDTIREIESKLAELEERMIRDEERARFIKSNILEAARLRSADVDEHRRHLELVCEQGLKLDELCAQAGLRNEMTLRVFRYREQGGRAVPVSESGYFTIQLTRTR